MLKFQYISPIIFEQDLANSKSNVIFMYVQGKFVSDKTWHIVRVKLKDWAVTQDQAKDILCVRQMC